MFTFYIINSLGSLKDRKWVGDQDTIIIIIMTRISNIAEEYRNINRKLVRIRKSIISIINRAEYEHQWNQ